MHPTRVHAQTGTEKWIRWAEEKAQQLRYSLKQMGLPRIQRGYRPDASTLVWIQVTSWGAQIHITGGDAWVPDDPYHDLWNVASALNPGTKTGVYPVIPWAHQVQHTSSFYPSSDGTYIRRHWLVICRYCKRVAEYTWDETGEFTVGTEDAPFGSIDAYTGAYASNDTDGTQVTLRDGYVDDTGDHYTERTVSISPSLKQLSDDNPWGWFTGGETDLLGQEVNPGLRRSPSTPVTVSVNAALVDSWSQPNATNPLTTDSYVEYEMTYQITNADFTVYEVIKTRGSQLQYGTPVGDYLMAGDLPFNGGGGLWGVTSTTFHIEPGLYHASTIPGAAGGTATAVSMTSLASTLNSLGADSAAASAYPSRATAARQNLLGEIMRMIDNKRFGRYDDTPDASEVRLPLYLADMFLSSDHANFNFAYAVPTYSSTEFTVSYTGGGSGSSTRTFTFSSSVNPQLFADCYETTVAQSSPAVPAPPTPAWSVALGPLVQFAYDKVAMTFSRSTDNLPTASNAYFSQSVSPPLVLGQSQRLEYGGFYRVTGPDAKSVEGAVFAEPSDDPAGVDIGDLMERACIGTLSRDEAEYVTFKAINGSPAGAEYRREEHVHSDGTYTFIQPSIS